MWTNFTRRTNDPKLRFIEQVLRERGIRSRRHGESWHAPILQVTARDLDAAWDLLREDYFGDGVPLDDIPDDDPVFAEGE